MARKVNPKPEPMAIGQAVLLPESIDQRKLTTSTARDLYNALVRVRAAYQNEIRRYKDLEHLCAQREDQVLNTEAGRHYLAGQLGQREARIRDLEEKLAAAQDSAIDADAWRVYGTHAKNLLIAMAGFLTIPDPRAKA